jgi:hypothetical protein
MSQSVYSMRDMAQGVAELILAGRFGSFWDLAEEHLDRVRRDIGDERICPTIRTALRDIVLAVLGVILNGGLLAAWAHASSSRHVNCLDRVYLCAECTALTSYQFFLGSLRRTYTGSRPLDEGYARRMGIICNENTGMEYRVAPTDTNEMNLQMFPLDWRAGFTHPDGPEAISGILRIFNAMFSLFGIPLPLDKPMRVELDQPVEVRDVVFRPLEMLRKDPRCVPEFEKMQDHLERQWNMFQGQLFRDAAAQLAFIGDPRARSA